MEAEGAVAVIGMACRYPGASGVDGFWAALRDGTEGITHFDRDDLVAGGADPELVRRVDYVPARGTVAQVEDVCAFKYRRVVFRHFFS